MLHKRTLTSSDLGTRCYLPSSALLDGIKMVVQECMHVNIAQCQILIPEHVRLYIIMAFLRNTSMDATA